MQSQNQLWRAFIPHIILHLGFLRVSVEEKQPWQKDGAPTTMSISYYVQKKTTSASDDEMMVAELLSSQNDGRPSYIEENLKTMEKILSEPVEQKQIKSIRSQNFKEKAYNNIPKTYPILQNLSYRNRTRLKWRTTRLEDHSSNKMVQDLFSNKNNWLTLRKRRLLSFKQNLIAENNAVLEKKPLPISKVKATEIPNLLSTKTTVDADNATTDDQEEIMQIRRRLRHSEDAVWGVACTVFILVLLVWAVWFSGMCKGSLDTYVYAEYSTSIQHMSVREMLKSRARFLPIFKSRRHRGGRYEEIPLVDDAIASDDENDDLVYSRQWESIETNT